MFKTVCEKVSPGPFGEYISNKVPILNNNLKYFLTRLTRQLPCASTVGSKAHFSGITLQIYLVLFESQTQVFC